MSETPGTHKQEIKLFYCYAREDKVFRDELEIHLSGLRRQYRLTNWSDREILPGENWEEAIDTNLNAADIILLLISPHFLASDYCYGKEMKRALQRHQAGTCCVIPILLRPTYWGDAPFSAIQMLPTDAKPLTRWSDRDDAFHDIVLGINNTIKALLVSRKTKEEWLKEGNALSDLKRYEEALVACEQAIRLDPNYAPAYNGKGVTLSDLKRYEEALTAFEQAIGLDPNDALAYNNKGVALNELKRYEEALAACEQAIRLDPNNSDALRNKGVALYGLGRYKEALAACEKAIHFNPDDAYTYHAKGNALFDLERYEEALAAYEQTIRLNPNDAKHYYYKGIALYRLKHYKEALSAYEQAIRLNPNDGSYYYYKGIVLNALKRNEEAKQAFEKVRQLKNGKQ